MCILIVKKAGVKAPSKKILQNCFSSNPDGAGFSYMNKSNVVIDKGFMNFTSFYKSFNQLGLTDKDVIIHFRIATHGTVCAANCHPFEISAGVSGAHNGIFPIKSVNNKTDSEIFFRDIFKPLIDVFGKSDTLDKVLNMIIGSSKIAILHHTHGLITAGNFIADSGVMYSNSSYKPYKPYKPSAGFYKNDSFNYQSWLKRSDELKLREYTGRPVLYGSDEYYE